MVGRPSTCPDQAIRFHLPDGVTRSSSLTLPAVYKALQECRKDRRAAARILGIARCMLYAKMKKSQPYRASLPISSNPACPTSIVAVAILGIENAFPRIWNPPPRGEVTATRGGLAHSCTAQAF